MEAGVTIAKLLLIGSLAGLVVFLPLAIADDDCGTCCRIERDKDRALREWAENFTDCAAAEASDDDSCELANLYAERYQRFVLDYSAKCVPQLRLE